MHYSNGRAAKVGDLVRGKGYNFKHEIIGILISAKPAESACNCSVACFGIRSDWPQVFAKASAAPNIEGTGWMLVGGGQVEAQSTVEYGQLDAFVALDPNTGEVLPPES